MHSIPSDYLLFFFCLFLFLLLFLSAELDTSWRLGLAEWTDIWSSSNWCLVPRPGLAGPSPDGGRVKLLDKTKKSSDSFPGNRLEAVR